MDPSNLQTWGSVWQNWWESTVRTCLRYVGFRLYVHRWNVVVLHQIHLQLKNTADQWSISWYLSCRLWRGKRWISTWLFNTGNTGTPQNFGFQQVSISFSNLNSELPPCVWHGGKLINQLIKGIMRKIRIIHRESESVSSKYPVVQPVNALIIWQTRSQINSLRCRRRWWTEPRSSWNTETRTKV